MAKTLTALLFALSAFSFFAQAQNQTIQPCDPPNQPKICPLDLTDICVYPKTGIPYMTKTNHCMACESPNIEGTSTGPCLPTDAKK